VLYQLSYCGGSKPSIARVHNPGMLVLSRADVEELLDLDALVEAVAAAMADRPGLVLADIQLADDSSGIDAVKDILAEFQVPVIFITAFPERLLTGERPEPTFLITKPFQRSTVKAAIAQALFFDAATVPAG
jgi:two-component SAPR family response regulator